jgi:phosphatidylserine/phosphatidylglycerophosphate/cardiolipin synthase-like enzyme
MTLVTGRVIEAESGTPLNNVRVVALGDWFLTTEKLAETTSGPDDGRFGVRVADLPGIQVPPSFLVRLMDNAGRPLRADLDAAGTVPTVDLGDVRVNRLDAGGLLVTHLTGRASMVSDGNALTLLPDGTAAFGRVAEDLKACRHSVNMTELFFDFPKAFDPDPTKEEPALVFRFDGLPIQPLEPGENVPANLPSRAHDDRPERLLLDLATRGRTVRILLNEPAFGMPEGLLWLGLLTGLAVGLVTTAVALIGLVTGLGLLFVAVGLGLAAARFEANTIAEKLRGKTNVDEAQGYFGSALENAPATTVPLQVRGFRQPLPHTGVMHCKMVITDEERAVVIGSPFEQIYFDLLHHRIVDPHRGDSSGDMIHDMSIGVVGPAVRHLYETFRLFWNEDLPTAQRLPESTTTPTAQTTGGDAVSTVQVVRTLSEKRFAGLGGISEKGILEGYLRAFAAAKTYIYLETQYFTDGVITDALCEALRRTTSLDVILLLNIRPDVPLYPRRQAKRIDQLRAAGGNRVGVFTRWSYDPRTPGEPPWIAPIYVHAKASVVDDSWVTVGSANLDGLSLDYNLLMSPLVAGETTATELNVNVIPATIGQPTPFGIHTRRRLFAEHLGLVDAAGAPNPQDPLLDNPARRWLDLWTTRSQAALAHVKAFRNQPLPGCVLPYPTQDGGSHTTARRHLKLLGVDTERTPARIRPLAGTRRFHFATGRWDADHEVEDLKR